MRENRFVGQIREVLQDEAAADFLPDYLETIRSNMDKLVSKVPTTTILMLALIVLFELLRSAVVTEFSVGPIRIEDLSLVQKLIPVSVAYSYYSVSSAMAAIGLQLALTSAIYSEYQPTYHRHHLEHFYYPTDPMVAGFSVAIRIRGHLSKLTLVSRVIIQETAITYLPIGFVVYAAVVSILEFGWTDIVLWLSLALSLILTLQGILISRTWRQVAYEEVPTIGEDTTE